MSKNRYDVLFRKFEDVEKQFDWISTFKPCITHELIFGPDASPWNEEEFQAFKNANIGRDGFAWEEWSLWPTKLACSRYSGRDIETKRFMRLFQDLSARAFHVLLEFKRLNAGAVIPLEFSVCRMKRLHLISPDNGLHGWLRLIHEWAYKFPMAGLQGDCGWWGYTGPSDDIEGINEQKAMCQKSGCIYYRHPVYNTLRGEDVFKASSAFIRFCKNPSEPIPMAAHDGKPEIEVPPPPTLPTWKTDSGELWVGGRMAKRITKPAWNQRRVLDDFEAQGWPRQIRNPFKNSASPRDANVSLAQTAENLNDNLCLPEILRFGTGEKEKYIYWKTVGELSL